MKPEQNFDAFLTQQLQSTHHYIHDEGFSENVLANLPPRKKLSSVLEKLIMVLPATLIALLVLSQFSWRDSLQTTYAWLLTVNFVSLVQAGAIMAMLVLFFCIASLFRGA